MATRKVRFCGIAQTVVILFVLAAYVSIVEQRAPALRAARMTVMMLAGSFLDEVDQLSSAAVGSTAAACEEGDGIPAFGATAIETSDPSRCRLSVGRIPPRDQSLPSHSMQL